MAKSKHSLSETQIAKRIKEGRGSDSGVDYSPWVRVDEVPSLGRSRHVYSHLSKRIHHLLSDLEFAVFLPLDNNSSVTECEIDPVAKTNIDWLYVVKRELELGDKVHTASSMFKAVVTV